MSTTASAVSSPSADLRRRLRRWLLWVPCFGVLLPISLGVIALVRASTHSEYGTLRTLLGNGELFLGAALILGVVCRDLTDLQPRPEEIYFLSIIATVLLSATWASPRRADGGYDA